MDIDNGGKNLASMICSFLISVFFLSMRTLIFYIIFERTSSFCVALLTTTSVCEPDAPSNKILGQGNRAMINLGRKDGGGGEQRERERELGLSCAK